MATNHTENYALNLWEPQDAFLRAEFNENSKKLDAALRALEQSKATTSAVSALQTSVTNLATQTDTRLTALATQTDTQLKALATQTDARMDTAAARTEAVAATVPTIKFGTYIGDGAESRFIEVGFTPQIVFVIRRDGFTYLYSYHDGVYCGLAARNHPSMLEVASLTCNIVEIVEGGFNVTYRNSGSIRAGTNENYIEFYYVAVG